MWWKIYFWIYLAILAFGIVGIVSQISKLSLGDWVSTINNVVLLFGSYVYIFNKQNFFSWKNIFLVNLILFAIFMVDYFLFSENLLGSILPSLKSNLGLGQGEIIFAVFAVIASLPTIYANFKLVTKK